MSTPEKLLQMVIAVAIFFAVVAAILFVTQRLRSRRGELVQSAAFILPALLLIVVGLLYPALKTIYLSFTTGAINHTRFAGIDNYKTIFTNKTYLTVLENTAMWVVLTPVVATFIGLIYAVLVDRSPFERMAKALVFLPMAISLVGASIIWKFVYDPNIGLLNAITGKLGLGSDHTWYASLTSHPWNNVWLIVILIWVQTGFAMTVLSAAIKAIPSDIVEAARLDGVGAFQMFRFITVPSIRPTLIVVLTTITIATLKAFDIIQTIAAGGAYHTSVLAYEFYFQQFKSANTGLASALAVLIFVLVVPVVVYNVRQMRKAV
jgi:alpha-glucoside transport system permease protein